MQNSKIVRYLDSLTPETDFKTLLETKFDIEVPVGAPTYQVEYLYKCLLVEQANGTKHSDMLIKAKQHFDELLNKFPWLATSETIKTPIVKERVPGALPTKDKVPDGTVAYCIRREQFCVYVGEVIRIQAKTIEGAKMLTEKRFGITEFCL